MTICDTNEKTFAISSYHYEYIVAFVQYDNGVYYFEAYDSTARRPIAHRKYFSIIFTL